jgi:hypothetical protein
VWITSTPSAASIASTRLVILDARALEEIARGEVGDVAGERGGVGGGAGYGERKKEGNAEGEKARQGGERGKRGRETRGIFTDKTGRWFWGTAVGNRRSVLRSGR